jgi:tetratricopeptide (TPR) repeat protein
MVNPQADPTAAELASGLPPVPACMICGRQDETLRLTAFPYVFSLLIVTYRRAFVGLWCQKHRSRYWFLSGLITALVGWFGIPFGLVYTPQALFKLARGGEQPAAQNQRLLQILAGHKLRLGDTEGAIRCLEAALRINDDEAGRRRLADLYAQAGPVARQAPSARLWPLLAAILGAIVLGVTIGLLDAAFTALFSALFPEAGNLLLVILSWAPEVVLLFLGGLVLIQLVDRALRRIGCRRMGLAVAFAVVVALVTLYGTLQGKAIAYTLAEATSGEGLGGGFDAILMGWVALTVGGGLIVVEMVQSGLASGLIALVLLLVAAVYYVDAGLRTARGVVRWQRALAAVQTGGQAPPVRGLHRGWLAVAAVVLVIACSVASLPLAAGVSSFGQGIANLGQAHDLLERGQVDEAVAELEALVQEEPDLAIGHATLGTLYLRRGQFDRATEEFEMAVALQPDSGLWHALLAQPYYLAGQSDLAREELRQAGELGADDSFTQYMVGTVHYAMDDFSQAEACYLRSMELSPEEPWAHLYLARLYALQARHEQALEMCDRALELGEEPVDVHLARGYVHLYHEDLDRAEEAYSAALALAPEDAAVHTALSYLYFLRAETAASQQEAQQALALDPYDHNAYRNLALALHAQGDLDGALAQAQEAVRLHPQFDTIYYVLGLCYRDKGDSQAAVQAFERFLDLYLDRPYVREWKAEAEAYLAERE